VDTYIDILLRRSNVREFVALQPTSPLRMQRNVEDAIGLFHHTDADCVMAICPAPHPKSWFLEVGDANRLKTRVPIKNSQEEPAYFIPNGAIFVCKRIPFMTTHSYYGYNTFGYRMPSWQSLDIDTPSDLEIARLRMTKENGFIRND